MTVTFFFIQQWTGGVVSRRLTNLGWSARQKPRNVAAFVLSRLWLEASDLNALFFGFNTTNNRNAYIGGMKNTTLNLPVATSDFVTRKNHGEFMSDRIERLSDWVRRSEWPGTFAAWAIEDLQSATDHVKNNRWTDAHEMLVGALLGVRFTNDHVVSAQHFTEQLATFEQWVHTIKSDIQKLIP